jgi:hypothetical protein
MTAVVLTDVLALAVGALALYAVLIWQANVYSRAVRWQPPAGNEQMDWTLRRNLALALGALATAVGAVSSAMVLQAWPLRLLVAAQVAMMAASGSSDLRRFHIPLPLTLLGLGLAIVTIANQQLPLLVVAFSLVWSFIVILMHALLSKGSMQLGDHISTVWIALASPFNGLIAIAAGDAANVILARVKGLRGKKVAAAGAWLLFAAALVGLPPYLAWFGSSLPTTPLAPVKEHIKRNDLTYQSATAHTLLTLTEWASDYTAGVAFANQHDERVSAAREAATHVTRLAALARQLAPASDVVPAMTDLADALAVYDVEGVRSASQRLADARLQIKSIVITSTSVMEQ